MTGLRTDDFDYDLPPGRIARRPVEPRDHARLLAIERSTGRLADRRFDDLVALVAPHDTLVLNDSRVFPARILGHKSTGAAAEVLLTRPLAEGLDDGGPWEWEAIVRPGARLKPGATVVVSPELSIEIVDSTPEGSRLVRLLGAASPWELIEAHGHVPLPPYIDRADDTADRTAYQTVYARHRGSVAAPTAGLHFTRALLGRLEERGVHVARLTLHVGIGTFRPVAAERIEDHRLHAEWYRVDEGCAAAVARARERGGRVWAIGTTACRVLEAAGAGREDRMIVPGEGWTDLFIRPPHSFRVVDALVTNFHLPRSSLIMLVAAFAGLEVTHRAYRHAIESGYRFYSYGDAMAIS